MLCIAFQFWNESQNGQIDLSSSLQAPTIFVFDKAYYQNENGKKHADNFKSYSHRNV